MMCNNYHKDLRVMKHQMNYHWSYLLVHDAVCRWAKSTMPWPSLCTSSRRSGDSWPLHCSTPSHAHCNILTLSEHSCSTGWVGGSDVCVHVC